jgi:hypothetical protein
VQLSPQSLLARWNYVLSLVALGDTARVRNAALEALPLYAAHLKLYPTAESALVQHTHILLHSGNVSSARAEALRLRNIVTDSGNRYDLACALTQTGEHLEALELLHQAANDGLPSIDFVRKDRDLDPLREMPEFQSFVKKVEKNAEGSRSHA